MSNHKARQSKTDESVVGNSDNSRVLLDSGMENSSSSIKTDEDDLPLSHLKDSKVSYSVLIMQNLKEKKNSFNVFLCTVWKTKTTSQYNTIKVAC